MEDTNNNFNINDSNILELSFQSKSQLNFGIQYSKKISKLKIFIYGLRGVSQTKYNRTLKYIVRCRNFQKFNIIRCNSNNSI